MGVMKSDATTNRWMRDASDEFAVANGCRFNERRGQYTVDWIEKYLRLYEGVWAGQPVTLKDWQYEVTMRLFGWERPNVDWRELDTDWLRRFRAGVVFIAKKNKKSPTLAAWMVFMLCGAGVHGQKCFPGAKDGAQIRQNVMRHVMEMVRQSPKLSRKCKINLNEASVFYEPKRSLLMPLSSSNVRTEKSKEGLNGSIFIDEVHVVDESFVRRIDRAGISRPEPLHVEVSTAGDDTDSYGYKRYEYAEKIISGEAKDDATLAMIYAAPQDLKDEDLAADPIKYGKMANPAWGHTVKESEFLADYERSKQSLRALADFKMYRLNIWQATATPWLDMAAWDACDADREWDWEAGGYAGLDLSSKRDFTGWRMVQKQGDTWVTDGHAWLTESRARKHSDIGLPVYDWAKEGHLTICPNERIDYDTVTSRVVADAKAFGIEAVGYDEWQAEYAQQVLVKAGVTMVEVPQGYKHLTDPSKELEAAVASSQLAHAGDPCLRWMAKNATVKHDNKDNICPVKPGRDTMKAIDGIVALVMAIGQAQAGEGDGPSIYEEPGALFG